MHSGLYIFHIHHHFNVNSFDVHDTSSPSTSGLNSPAPELVTAPQPYPRIGRSASLRRSSLQHPNLSITIAQRAYSHQGLHEHATEHNTAANTLRFFYFFIFYFYNLPLKHCFFISK
jgi:hypothetical protein